MKGLYKKISAIVLAGMVVFGGGALGGIQKVDAVSWLEIKIPGESDVKWFAKKYEFEIFAMGGQVEQYIQQKIKNPGLKKRLSQVEGKFKDRDELENYVKGVRKVKKYKKLHRIQYQGREYLLYFK